MGGVVFGAKFNQQWPAEITHTESIKDLSAFRGSKYMQASVGQSYRKAKSFLDQGRMVLYSGTPCQIAGLNLYLQRPYNNLIDCRFHLSRYTISKSLATLPSRGHE